jgi:Uma2 family endonuclease
MRDMVTDQGRPIVMVSSQPQPRYTVEAYLVLERDSEERHEYLDGNIYLMAGESPEHGAICMNLSITLGSQLRGTPCQAFAKDTKVRSGPIPRPGSPMKGLFSYPDLLVVCGDLQFHDPFRDVLLNPTLIIEVLSDSTEAFDRGEKFRRYRTWLSTLTDYLLVAQDMPLIDHYHRVEANRWELIAVEGLEASLYLDSLNCSLPLADVYDRIVFPPEEPAFGQAPPVN